jgi:hypothetical protein
LAVPLPDHLRKETPMNSEIPMKKTGKLRAGLAFCAIGLSLALGGAAFAGDMHSPQSMWLSCKNGHNYPIRAMAVSRDGDLVTGYLLRTGTGHAIHLRLVPMGSGYRYTGSGIWFDGLRGEAVLNWGRPDEVPCTVAQE